MSPGALLQSGVDLGEMLVRQIYWRFGYEVAPQLGLESARTSKPAATVAKSALSERLHAIGAGARGLLMVHASLDPFTIADAGPRMPRPRMALWLLAVLREVVGADGTLCMPTHPMHRDSPGFMFDKSEIVLPYSVRKTPSGAGALSELFRRSRGTLRSRHPLSSLAANGPLARELLANNSHGQEPLPHGRDSGYHRFCQMGGRVIGLGIDLVKVLTVLQVAEEVRDESWPIADFFYRRHFKVEDETGQRAPVVVRERRPEFVRALPLRRVRRDLLAQGILSESTVSGVRLDVVDAKALLEFMQEKQRKSPYPYLFPELARISKAPRPTTRRVAAARTP